MLDQTALLLLIKSYKDQQLSAAVFYRQLTEIITKQLQCSRASLWLFAEAQQEIVALDLYDSLRNQHEQGQVLRAADFAPYFAAMRLEGGIDAADARQHPATRCFNTLYFEPYDIYSLLDVGIRLDGELVGVFCCEQVGAVQQWSAAQIAFLQQAGKLMNFALRPLLQQKFAALL